ncbi:MAG TPA: hypothetical protein VF039_00860 [Longimicrobiales bacterium]
MRFSAFRRAAVPALLLPLLAACNEEPVDPFRDWDAIEDTVTLYTADRVEHQGLFAAYDIVNSRSLRIEDPAASGAWDFVLTGGDGTPLTLTPLGAFFDVDNRAGLHVDRDAEFLPLERAPSAESAYVTDEPVTVEDDVIYIIRSRQTSGGCVRFAKLDPLEIDQEVGSLTFRVIRNPRCNDTDLVPPED